LVDAGTFTGTRRVPVLQQLNLKVPPEVAASWREQAAAAGHSSIRDWLVAITTTNRQAPAAGGGDLLQRIEALERALVALQHPRPRPTPAPAPDAPQLALIPDPLPAAPALDPVPLVEGEGITTAELAERTGTNRAAWNNWAARSAPGDVRHHETAGAWRLVGKAPAPGGGPSRWLWAPVES